MPALFTKFGKLQRTAAMNSDGIGLGLTICKQIVEQAGGSIAAYSEGTNKGSTFKFSMNLEMLYESELMTTTDQS